MPRGIGVTLQFAAMYTVLMPRRMSIEAAGR